MKKVLIISIILLINITSLADAKRRDVEAIGEEAVRRGIITAPPKGRDFTRIPAGAVYEPTQLIVRFASKADGRQRSVREKNQLLVGFGGGTVKRNYKLVPGLSVVKLPAGLTVEAALKRFNKANGIVYAEPDYEVKAVQIPNDYYFNQLWGMHNTGQSGGTVDADIDAPEAWDIATGSSDVIVAVIDTGVAYNHEDLADNMWVNAAEASGTTGIDDDENGYVDDIYGYDFCTYNAKARDSDPMDEHDHGTHCSGTIGAVGNNNEGVVGVCWDVKIMALRFLDPQGYGWCSDAIDCLEYSVLMGANLTSNSWGRYGYNQSLKDAIEATGAAGMLFVAAAGNDDYDNDGWDPHYPSSFDSECLISVMATDRNDNKSSFSSYGLKSVDLGAPGSSIFSCERGNDYGWMNGTSMATPHVAGACALLWSVEPNLSNIEVKNILLETVDKTLPGLCVSEGRLNLYQAVLSVAVISKGRIELDEDYYSCNDEVEITLADIDIAGQGTWDVNITCVNDLEVVTLEETGANSGVFSGTISTDVNDVNGTLQVFHGATITVTYHDANDGSGNPADVNDTATADCDYPVIFNVEIDASEYRPVITFETNEPTTVCVLCDVNCGGETIEVNGSALAEEHTIILSGLSADTDYFFMIEAMDAAGNVTVDNNNSNCYTFTTIVRNYDLYVPSQFSTIQGAIDAAWDGDIVWVAPGTYTGDGNRDLDFEGRAITVRSNDPNDPKIVEATVIDCNGAVEDFHRAFYFHSDEDANSVISGLTMINGFPYWRGAGIYCEHSSPTIKNCVIRDCGSWAYHDGGGITCYSNSNAQIVNCIIKDNGAWLGGGIYCQDSNPTIQNCTITENEALYGAGIGCLVSSANIINCKISKNSAKNWYMYGSTGGGIGSWDSDLNIRGCMITENTSKWGGGIYTQDNEPVLVNCTISKNSSQNEGGGIYAYGSKTTVTGCILWGDDAGTGIDEIYNDSSTTTFSYSDIEGSGGSENWNSGFGIDGGGNIDSDPLFADADANDFHLDPLSPCIDVGEPYDDYSWQADMDGEPRLADGDGNSTLVVDIGADEYMLVYNTNAWWGCLSIQVVIDDANDGDEIVVCEGTFYESIDFNGVSCTLRSTKPNDWAVVAATIIDANGATQAAYIDTNSVLSGFTITGGTHGVYCNSVSPMISKCIIEDNSTTGIYCSSSNAEISNNKIRDNGDFGIRSYASVPIIKNNWVYRNGDTGIKFEEKADAAATVRNNTVAYNIIKGVWSHGKATDPVVSNCILWENDNDIAGCTATYSCIQDGDSGTGNISSDPCFVDSDSNDFHLRTESWCINAGNSAVIDSNELDIDFDERVIGREVDMGADETYHPIGYWKMDDNAANRYVAGSSGTPTELVTNGRFTSSTGWTFSGNWSYDSENEEADHSGWGEWALSQNISVTAGKRYMVTFTVKNYTSGGVAFILGGQNGTERSANGTYAEVVTAINTDGLEFWGVTIYTGSIDDVFCFCLDDFPNGTFCDDTGDPNTNAHSTTGQIDGALIFDGQDDYVTVGSPDVLDNLPLDDFTVSAWIYDKYSAGTTWGTIMGCYAYNNGWSFRTFSDANGDRSLYFQAPHSAGDYGKWANSWSIDGTIIPNTWHHATAVWDASTKTAKLYIDGVEPSYQKSDPGVGPYNSDASRNKEIGRIPHVGGGHYFNGKIDDVRIYDRFLSAEEVHQVYQQGFVRAFNPAPADGAINVEPDLVLSWTAGYWATSHDVYFGTDFTDVNDATTASSEYIGNFDSNSYDPNCLDYEVTYYWRIDEVKSPTVWKGDTWSFTTRESYLMSWWKFDEGSGTTAYDSEGDNDGTIIGDPCWTTGQIDGALVFDGNDDYVDLDAHIGDYQNLSEGAVSMWLNNIEDEGGMFFSACRSDATTEIYFQILSDGKLKIRICPSDPPGSLLYWISNNALPSGWHHFVYSTRTSPSGNWMYLDGEPISGAYTKGSPSTNAFFSHVPNQDNLRIGNILSRGLENSWHFSGLIDDVRIYDKALSAGEVLKLYQDGL